METLFKQITSENYAESVQKFCSPLPLVEHNCHMAMGIVEEITTELVKAFSPERQDDFVNAIEEIGDICWFASQYCLANGLNFSEILADAYKLFESNTIQFDELEGTNELMILSITKKELAYKKVPTLEERQEAILNVCLQVILYSFHITRSLTIKGRIDTLFQKFEGLETDKELQQQAIEEAGAAAELTEEDTLALIAALPEWIASTVLQKNYNKLETRYGEKFSTDKAINRDLVAEEAVLSAK